MLAIDCDNALKHKLYEYNEGHAKVDALAYVDSLSHDTQEEVNGLISMEMAQMDGEKRDYLQRIPLPQTRLVTMFQNLDNKGTEFDGDGNPALLILNNEMRRVHSGDFMKPLNTARYALPPPAKHKEDILVEWEESVRNAKAQSQNLQEETLNLELATKYAKDVWLVYLQQVQNLSACYKRQLNTVRSEIEKVNKKRKMEQVAFSGEMSSLTRELADTMHRNSALATALIEAEFNVSQLRVKSRKEGIRIAAVDQFDSATCEVEDYF